MDLVQRRFPLVGLMYQQQPSPWREGVLGCVCHPNQECEDGTGLGQGGSRGKGQSEGRFGTAEWEQGGQGASEAWGGRRPGSLTNILSPSVPSMVGLSQLCTAVPAVPCGPWAGRMRATRLGMERTFLLYLSTSQQAASLHLPLAWQEEEKHRAASTGMGFSGSRIQFLSPLPKAEQMITITCFVWALSMLWIQYKDHKHSLTSLSSLHEKIPSTWSKPVMLSMAYREVSPLYIYIYCSSWFCN